MRHGEERHGRRAQRRDVVGEANDGRVREQRVTGRHYANRHEDRLGNVLTRIARLLGERRRVLPADEQIDREWECQCQSLETVVDVLGIEGAEPEGAMKLDQRRDADDEQDRHLEGEEDPGDLGRYLDAADHHEDREAQEDDRPDEPGHTH